MQHASVGYIFILLVLIHTITRLVGAVAGNVPRKLKAIGVCSHSSEKERILRALKGNGTMDMYQLGPVIGSGRFGKVRRATHRLSQQVVAMKIYNKAQVKVDDQIDLIRKEIDIMKEIDHPNVVRLYEILETSEYILIAMELCEGEDLGKLITRRNRLNEATARAIFQQLIEAISYLHRNNIIHRDIKPDNVFIQDNCSPLVVKILDFGLGSRDVVEPSKKLSAFCGTPAFMAPEIIFQESYDGKPVDAWSLGVLLYLMTVGKIPFDAKSTQALYKKILAGAFEIPTSISAELRDLLTNILVVDSNNRMRIEQIRHHPWLGLENQPTLAHIPSSLFVADSALHKEILAEMDGCGLDRLQLHDDLASKTYNGGTTWYRLLHLRRKKLATRAPPNDTDSTSLSSIDFSRFLKERISMAKNLTS
ncbi:Aste57867_13901 [Aphanomyces stellatus]|uniref:non-specific serine/threonine protein kinase n=1 Tax=Aphanomyces stellatus TaxID=120398 RepID=A0A485KZC5_9STRA|nr:hypothetical protein As57867_013850 [Aphanomyces stellatus]VFT90732.1 Aste57867_13901 [Aphanomyces stellatus]